MVSHGACSEERLPTEGSLTPKGKTLRVVVGQLEGSPEVLDDRDSRVGIRLGLVRRRKRLLFATLA